MYFTYFPRYSSVFVLQYPRFVILNLSNRPTPSIANPLSRTSYKKSHHSELHRKNAIKTKRFEHVRFVYLLSCMLLSRLYFSVSFWNFLFHMENGMDHLVYRCVYELVPESSSVLLAYSPTSDCSCEDGKRYVMHHH